MRLSNFRFRRVSNTERGQIIQATVDVRNGLLEFGGHSQSVVARDTSGRWYLVKEDQYLLPSLHEYCAVENARIENGDSHE